MSSRSTRSDANAARSEKQKAAVHVSLLVKVLAFDNDAMTVDVQPLNKILIDGEYVNDTPLLGLPVACISSGDYIIRPWYKRGDIGMVIILDGDSDNALQTGDEAEPNTERNHALEDGVFLGGICTAGNAPQGLPDNALVLAAGGSYIALGANGITISGNVTINGTVY